MAHVYERKFKDMATFKVRKADTRQIHARNICVWVGELLEYAVSHRMNGS